MDMHRIGRPMRDFILMVGIFCFLLIGGSGGREMVGTVPDTKTVDGDEEAPKSTGPKLLLILLDGFRWDYYEQHKRDLDGFEEFLTDGVRAAWVDPVFPSNSYPNWHTISTGLFPQHHGIIGNYMYDQKTESLFDLNDIPSTKNPNWWQKAEPVWITATRARKKVFLRYWSRCDVAFEETFPNGEFTGYRPEPGIGAFQKTLNVTLHKLRENDLLMVYGEHIDNIGHEYGPDSGDMAIALREVNRVFKWFLDELYDNYPDVEKDLHILIVSDHGLAESGSESNTTRVHLRNHLNPNHVLRVIGSGGSAAIAPLPRHSKEVYERLKEMEGVEVYRRDEIPDKLHYKQSLLVQDILLVAKPGYHIEGLPSDPRSRYGGQGGGEVSKQIPSFYEGEIRRRSGSHGYVNRTEMRGIFFAKGPEFKKGLTHPSIGMEDIYQMLTRILKIQEQPHNGTWSRVSGMFVNSATFGPGPSEMSLLLIAFFLSYCQWSPFHSS